MRELTILLGLFSFVCTGCGDNVDDGQDMSVDLAMTMDLASAPDLTMLDFSGISCGSATCDPASQDCCLVASGAGFSQMCMPRGTCSTDGGASIMCDGPEDCSGGNSCCISIGGMAGDAGVTGGGGSSMCSMGCGKAQASFGGGAFAITTKLCHTKADCVGYMGTAPVIGMTAFDGCCASPMFGPYRLCAPTAGMQLAGYTCN